MSRFLFIILAVAVCGVFPGVARAQSCETPPFEVIVTLRPPLFGFPTVWDARYAIKDKMVQIGSGIAEEGGTVFTIGRSFAKDNFKTENIVLAELNRRGRALKETAFPAKEAEDPVKMIRVGKEMVAVSNMRGGRGNAEKWVRISWYDGDGKYKHDKILKDPVFNLETLGIVPAVESSGFVVIAHAVNRSDAKDENGVLLRFTPKGDQVWRRAYRPGIPNQINGVTGVGDSNYIATGRIRLDDGRLAAWALKLGYDGAVQWQRTYPRGYSSLFRSATVSQSFTADGLGFILSGDTMPYDKGPKAAWVMAMDALGEPLWQRYYRRPDYELTGEGIRAEADGRLDLLLNAKTVEGTSGHDHVRLLTLSPRGAVLGDESYYEGLSTKATDYFGGMNGERIFTANVEQDEEKQKNPDEPIVVVGLAPDAADAVKEPELPKKPVFRGWVFVATALDPYEDPCAPGAR